MDLKYSPIEKYLPHFTTTLLALAICFISSAQVKFSTVVNEKQPALDDLVQVEYTVENAKSVENIATPSFKNFRVVQGPMQSNGMSYMNGVISQYKSLSYILQPLVKGRLTVPGTTAIINGKLVQSEPVTIEVRSAGAGSGGNRSIAPPGLSPLFPEAEPEVDEEYILKPGESMAEKIKNNLFVKTEVNKTTCYEGEPVMATFKLCSRLRSESRVLKRPSLNGFSVFDMIEPEENKPSIETINGRPFNVHLIRQTQLFPLQPGTFTIDPVELDNTVKFIRKTASDKSSRSPLQQFLDEMTNDRVHGEVEEHTFTLASKPVTITVKPLPAINKPAGFNGAVGKFTMHSNWKSKSVAVGDEISLQVKIEGKGNFTVINAPQVSLPDGIEGYDPVIKENVDKSIYPLSGSKTFDYTFIPKDTGFYKVPAVTFSYFDPSEARYKTERSDSFSIRVLPARRKTPFKQKILFPNPAADSSWIDILSINTLVALLAIGLGIFFGAYQWKKSRQNKKMAASAPVRQTPTLSEELARANTDPFEGAKWALRQERSQEFYNEINKAIWKELSEKIKIPATELNKFNVVTKLQNQGADTDTIYQLQALLNECEIALYTPVHTTTDMQYTLAKAESLISNLQATVT